MLLFVLLLLLLVTKSGAYLVKKNHDKFLRSRKIWWLITEKKKNMRILSGRQNGVENVKGRKREGVTTGKK